MKFTEARRERWLSMVEHGYSQQEACARVGVSPATISRWRLAGRAGRSDEQCEFADRLDAVVEGTCTVGLTEYDLVRLLENAARRGSVTAIKLLLDRIEARKVVERQVPSLGDELAAIRARKLTNPS